MKQILQFTAALVLAMLLGINVGWGANLINENIQSWTSRASYGNYTQTISAGTVNLTSCIVAPTGASSGTGTVGYVQMQGTNGILALPAISSAGTAEFRIHAGGAGRTLKLEKYNGSTWDLLTTFTIGSTGETFTYAVNSSSSTTLRLSTPSAAVYVHDIIITDYASPPSIALSSPSQVGSGNINQGSTNQILSHFQAVVTVANATLNSLTFTSAGTYSASDMVNFKLHYYTSDNFASASSISTLSSSLGTGSHTFSSLTQVINTSTTGYFWITCDVNALATPASTINVAADPALTFASGTPTGSISAGGTQTIQEVIPSITISSPNPAVEAGNITQNTTNNVIYRFDLAVTIANATISGLQVTTSGTYSASDLTNLKAWYSSDITFSAGGDVLLSTKTTSLGVGTQVFPGWTNQVITSGTTGYIFITTDIPCTATATNTIAVNAVTTSDVTFLSGNKSGTTSAGGAQTIVAATIANVTGYNASVANAQSVLTWTNPTGCYDEIMIVTKATSSISVTPTGDGTDYTASLVYGSGTSFDGGSVVYKGSTSSQTVTGLTNGTTYYYKFFTRFGTSWSAGVETNATPTINTDYFRSKATGNWNVPGTWESSADGSTGWATATTTPGENNTVYIQSGHTVTLTQYEACKDLHIANSTTSSLGTKGTVALASFTLSVNGKIRTYYAAVGTVPGTSANNGFSQYPFTVTTGGKISIVGNTRNLTNTGEWGATISTPSSGVFPIEINLTSGQTAILQTNIKCTSLAVVSGILSMVTIGIDNGTVGEGNVTISSGATVVSSVTSANIFQRTGTSRAGSLTLNGTLIFTGTAPQIAMNSIAFDGTVEYSNTGSQTLAVLNSSGASPNVYTNLILSGTNAKTLGVNTTVNGTLTLAGTASLALGSYSLTYGSSSTLEYAGSTAQTTSNTEFPASPLVGPKNVDINNSNGVTLNANKVINGTLTVKPSAVFDASTYIVSGAGDFDVQDGATFKSSHTSGLDGNNITSGELSSYSPGANYEFYGSTSQVTGSLLPTTLTGNLTISNSVGTSLSNSYTLNSPSAFAVSGIVDFGTDIISGTGAFALSSGATLKTSHSLGLNGSIAVSGSKSFDIASNYEFNGAGTQATGALLPATVNNLTLSGTSDLTISNDGLLTVSGNLSIGSTAKLNIGSTKSVTVTGNLSNTAAERLVIKSTSASATGSLLHYTSDVPATVERYIAAGTETETDHIYHVVSAPVSGQAVSLFTDVTDLYGFFRYDEAANLWVNSGSTSPPFGNTFVVGRGYMANFKTAQTPNFVGNLQSGTVTFNDPDVQEFTFSNGTYAGWGWNLIGNPYPSAIDWDAATGWSKEHVDNAIYHRDGAAWTSYNDGTPPNGNIIPVGQGVFVHANATSPVLAMTNDVRVHSNVAYHKEATVIENLLNITASGNERTDHAYLHFKDGPTTGFDSQFDAYKMFSDNNYYPQVYTISTDNSELSIDKRPIPEQNTDIPVCFKSGLNGSYTLSFAGIESFGTNVKFLLEDKLLNKVTDLREQPAVQIAYTTNDDPLRFILHLKDMVGISEPPAAAQVSVYAFGDKLYLDSKTITGPVHVELFNLTGQRIFAGSYAAIQSLTVPLQGAQGFYIVKVTGSDFIVSRKVYIR